MTTLLDEEFDDPDDCQIAIRDALLEIDRDLTDSALELRHLASGVRLQIKESYSIWVNRLWQRKPPKYSRALLETLALIAYKQPVTRGDIEQIRGVQVRTTTMRTLIERGWVQEVGKRQSPGYPTLFGTTAAFLDYFNLNSLEDLPPMRDIESLVSAETQDSAPDEPNEVGLLSADAAESEEVGEPIVEDDSSENV